MTRRTALTASEFETFLATERQRVDDAMAWVSESHAAPLPESLRDPVQYSLSTEGKRLRPILALLAWSAANAGTERPEALYRLSCSLEVIHTYSLVHDDLPCMDDDDLRRGRPTVHRVYGIPEATRAGAALLPIAIKVLDGQAAELGLDVTDRGRLVVELAQAAGAEGMVGGQLMDLEGEQRRISGDELEAIHRLKTGALLTASLRIGGIAGEADDGLLDALTRYGEALGLAFQIADDLLDVEGSSEDLGKTAGRDEELSKSSYPSLYGVDGARQMARDRVQEARHSLATYDLPHLEAIADYVIQRRH